MKLTCFEEEMKGRMLFCGHPLLYRSPKGKWVSPIRQFVFFIRKMGVHSSALKKVGVHNFLCYFGPAEGKLIVTFEPSRLKEGFMINEQEIRQQMERLSNQELISILLRRDEKQWQPEVFEIVGAILSERGTSSGKSVKYTVGSTGAFEETEGMDLKTIADYVSHLDAEEDRLILENEGVKAWIFEEDGVPSEGIPPSVQLKVCAEDWKDAMARLNAEDMVFPEPPDDNA
jgi:hypothetical protein